MLSGFMYILTIIAMSLQYPNGVCMPPPKIVYCFHCRANLLFLSFRYQKNYRKKWENTLEKAIFLLNLKHYSTPFVLGKASLYGFRFTAILIALANALKMASILWCSFSP